MNSNAGDKGFKKCTYETKRNRKRKESNVVRPAVLPLLLLVHANAMHGEELGTVETPLGIKAGRS